MAIITISRGTFAGGRLLAAELGQRLSYRIRSREDLFERVKERHGFSREQLDSIMTQAPQPTEVTGGAGERRSVGLLRRQLMVALQAELCELAGPDLVVYHGQVGHLLLASVGHVLRVRLIAPREQRVRLAMEHEGLTAAQAARKIDRVDEERARWTRAMYGVEWDDPAQFDLVINLEHMPLGEAADLVARAAGLPTFQATAASAAALALLGLRARVQAKLLCHLDTAHLEADIEVDARSGRVRLLGALATADMVKVTSLVRQVPGVTSVEI